MIKNIFKNKKMAEELERALEKNKELEKENKILRKKAREERETRYEIEKDYKYGEKTLIDFYEKRLAVS